MTPNARWPLGCAIILLTACSSPKTAEQQPKPKPEPSYFKVDPRTSTTITGTLTFKGKKPIAPPVDMSSDPACVEAHHGKQLDESLVVSSTGALANVFVYIKSGLEGKTF